VSEVAERSADPGFGSALRRGTLWSALDVAVGRGGQFVLGVFIARILAPKDFGVFAVALVIHMIVLSVGELGVSAALIRDVEDTRVRSAPTVATIALVTGSTLGVLMAVTAGPVSHLLGSGGRAAPAIAVMAINLPLSGLGAVPAALLRRDFRMDRLFVADAANLVFSGVFVVVFALAGWGPLALAWSWVIGQTATTVLLLTYKPGRFWPGWSTPEARRLLAFGLPLAGANVIAYSVLNVDYVIVGRVLGATMLGFYVLAFNISGWPMNVFGSIVRSVSLPGFARLQRHGESMPDRFAEGLRLVASISFPVCFVLGALGRPLIQTVYGSRWSLAATALVGLSLLGAARIVIELTGDFLITLGRTKAVFLAQIPWLIGLIVALLVGVHTHGIAGAGVAQAVVSIGLMVPLYFWFTVRAGVPVRLILGALVPPLLWSILAAAAAFLVSRTASDPVLACAAGASAALVVYLVANHRLVRDLQRLRRAGRSDPTDEGETDARALPDDVEPPIPLEIARDGG
jgi:PST family polysaccharide transporter